MCDCRKIMALVLFCFSLMPITAKEIKQHPKLRKGTLENGLTYYVFPNDFPKGEAVYRLFIKSGSLYETDEQKGLAHFLEHMAFNGTRHFPENEMVRFLESKGAKFGKDLNAHTSYNETVYKLALPSGSKGMVDTTLTILADWLDGLLLDHAEIDAERGVIMSEWLTKQNPDAEVSDALLSELMNHSRFSQRKVIGDTAVIQHFDYPVLRDYYETWYRPSLAAVAVVGDVDPVMVEAMIRDKFAGISDDHSVKPSHYGIPDYKENKAQVIVNKRLKKSELTLIRLVPLSDPVRSEKDYNTYLQRLLLNRLFKNRLNALSFKHNDYVSGSLGVSDFLNTKGVMLASVELSPDKPKAGMATFIAQLQQIFQYGFLKEEIDKVKRAHIASKERSARSEQPVASAKLMDEVYADFYKDYAVVTSQEEYRLTQKYIDGIDSLSLMGALQEINQNMHTHAIYSSFKEGDFADSLQLLQLIDSIQLLPTTRYQLDIDMPDRLLPNEPVLGSIVGEKEIPAIDGVEYLLSNGVRVIYKKAVSSRERISVSAYKRGGLYALDSVDYVNGLFSPSVVSLSGAGNFSRDALSSYLAGISVSVRMLIENSRAGMVGSATIEDMETFFQLLHLKWTHPNADPEVFEMVKKRSVEAFRQRNVTDQTIYYKELNYLLKGRDYVTREVSDTRIEQHSSLQKVIPVFNRFFGNAHGFTFVIISDINPEELKPYISRYIASLPGGDARQGTPFVYLGGDIRTQSAKFVRNAGDSDRAAVSLVFQRTDVPEDKELFDLKSNMVASILKMKLMSEIREKMGMVYSVSVTAGSRKYPSPLSRATISFTTKPENADLLISRIKEILATMKNDPDCFTTELDNVKQNLIKEMAVNVQKDAYWSTFIRNATYNDNEDWRYVSDYPTLVNNITNRELSKLLSENFDVERMIESVLLPKK